LLRRKVFCEKAAAALVAASMLMATGCTAGDADEAGSTAVAAGDNVAIEATDVQEEETMPEDEALGAASEEESQPDESEEETQPDEASMEAETEEATEDWAEEQTEEETEVETQPEQTIEGVTQPQEETEPVTEETTQEEKVTEVQTETASNKLVAPFGIAFLGDSITVGYYSGYSYADVVCEDLGCVQFNYGVAGNTLASYDGKGFVERYTSINPDCKVIVVYGGSNDFYNDVELGSLDSTKKDEFYGALKKLCSGLKESYPNANIVFMTPLPGEFEGHHNSSNNETGSSMWDYVDAMQKVCADYGIPVIDMYHNFEITANNYEDYTADGLHPNEKGHDVIAKALEDYIRSLM